MLYFINQQQDLEDDTNDTEEEGSAKDVGNIHEAEGDGDGGKDKEPRWMLKIFAQFRFLEIYGNLLKLHGMVGYCSSCCH